MLYIYIPADEPEVSEAAHTNGAGTLNGCNGAQVTDSVKPEPEPDMEQTKWGGLDALQQGLDQLYTACEKNRKLLAELPIATPPVTAEVMLHRFENIETFYAQVYPTAFFGNVEAAVKARIDQLCKAIDDIESLLDVLPSELPSGADRALFALCSHFKV